MHFRVFLWGSLWGLLRFQIFLGCLIFLKFFFFFFGGGGGLNNKTGPKPADEEKIEYPLEVIYVLIFFLLF